MSENGYFKQNFSKLFLVELLVLFFSLAPLLILKLAPSLIEAELESMNEEQYIFIYGLITYITYPLISIVMAFCVGFSGIKWYGAALCGPISYMIGSALFLGTGVVELLLWGMIDYILGLGLAYLGNRIRSRREDVTRLIKAPASGRKK